MKKELLNQLNLIARGTIIELNGKQYVKDTDTTTNQTYWFSMDGDGKLTNEEVAKIILK